jgi:hypothetical protein
MMLAGTAARPLVPGGAHGDALECEGRRPASRKPSRGGDWIAREQLCR